jgi:hypothetical protein
MDIQQDQGTSDVIAVQFAALDRVVGADGAATPATTVETAVRAIHANPGLVVIDESASSLGGLDGLNVTVDNQGAPHAPIMDVSAGRLGIDPGRRLWMSLFDTPDGVLAVMVGGSAATWDDARVCRQACIAWRPLLSCATLLSLTASIRLFVRTFRTFLKRQRQVM